MKTKGESFGPVGQKIILLLAAGVVLGLSHSPKQHFSTLKATRRAWKDIDDRALHYAIRSLYRARLIQAIDHIDGAITMVLTDKGKQKALRYKIDEMTIPKMNRWDNMWRIVIFDIPESHKKARDALSQTLKRMEFYQLQKSVLIHPFECDDELDFIIEFFMLRPYVRKILAQHVDNELHLKKHFKL